MTKARELSDYTGLQGDLALKSTVASPVFTGNVGIGVTPETDWHSGKEAIQLGVGASIYGDTTATGNQISANARSTLGSTLNGYKYISTDKASTYHQYDGAHNFRVAASGTADAAISWTTAMTIDNDGIVTKPNQPSFLVRKSAVQSNISINSWVTISFDVEHFDQNANFSGNAFTAPVTGRYQLNASVRFNVDDAATYYHVEINTSNRVHRTTDHTKNFANGDIDYYTQSISILADMDAGDTAFLRIYQNGGAAITDINTDTRFSGFLAC